MPNGLNQNHELYKLSFLKEKIHDLAFQLLRNEDE